MTFQFCKVANWVTQIGASRGIIYLTTNDTNNKQRNGDYAMITHYSAAFKKHETQKTYRFNKFLASFKYPMIMLGLTIIMVYFIHITNVSLWK